MKTKVYFGLFLCFFGNFVLIAMANLITSSISKFSTDLYVALAKDQTSNVVFSPFLMHIALSMMLMGAEDDTAEEILHGLKLNGTYSEIADGIHQLLVPIEQSTTLKVANKLYIGDSHSINPQYYKVCKEKFNSEVEWLNFKDSDESADIINNWMKEKTNNTIKEIIKPNALTVNTSMILVNAIYFKGVWLHPFKKELTFEAPFFISETESVKVDMMYVKEHFYYGQFPELNSDGIILPYKDSNMSMFIILPNNRTGLAQLEQLKDVDLQHLQGNMNKVEATVILPKMKFEFEVSFHDILQELGMGQMFTKSADFSGITFEDEEIQITDILHKAFIDVNEEGSEAAAIQTVVSYSNSLSKGPLLSMDHPFFFAIGANGTFYFMGKYLTPE